MSTFIDFFINVSDCKAGCNHSSRCKYEQLNTLSTGSRSPLGLSGFIRKDVLGPFRTVSEGSDIVTITRVRFIAGDLSSINKTSSTRDSLAMMNCPVLDISPVLLSCPD
jgi:hypothetical protein